MFWLQITDANKQKKWLVLSGPSEVMLEQGEDGHCGGKHGEQTVQRPWG